MSGGDRRAIPAPPRGAGAPVSRVTPDRAARGAYLSTMFRWPPRRAQDPDPESFRQLAEAAYLRIPDGFRAMTGDISILTPDLPGDDVLRELGIGDPYGLLGLYQGVDVTRKSLFDITAQPDRIFLYRLPIIAYWRSGGDSLEAIVEHVLVHEIGHHFGFSDADMHAIEEDAD